MNNGTILKSVMKYNPKNQYRFKTVEHEMERSHITLRN
jgi:hypothetical protein